MILLLHIILKVYMTQFYTCFSDANCSKLIQGQKHSAFLQLGLAFDNSDSVWLYVVYSAK